jgi:hypothetical protein
MLRWISAFSFAALEDGVLEPVLRLSCTTHCNAVSLVAVSTLSLIAEDTNTHTKILESPLNVLSSVCSLAASEDEQVKQGRGKIYRLVEKWTTGASYQFGSQSHIHI